MEKTDVLYVIDLDDVDGTQVAAVGGKAAQLGELVRLDGVAVPDGFCVTTAAFHDVVTPAIEGALDRLAGVEAGDREAIAALGREVRERVRRVDLPAELTAQITTGLLRLGADQAVAVRSSATAEDLPTASFAGQHDSFLDVVGRPAVLEHVRRCWASLFTERAISYRARRRLDHRDVRMAVVVQRMVAADAAGVLFTADPVTGNRTVTTVDAVRGLGEALVSGQVTPDSYRVHDGIVTATTTSAVPVLTGDQVARLAALGRRIEEHLGAPQDVEWCLTGDDVHMVQSRAVTTLFPVPVTAEQGRRVYLSVGHQQMMTDPMKALGLSLWHHTTSAVMSEAGGRLFVDATDRLVSRAGREALLGLMAADPLTADALRSVLARDDVLPPPTDDAPTGPPRGGAPSPVDTDPALVTALIARSEASLAALRHDVAALSGPALFDVLPSAFEQDRALLFDPQSIPVIMAGMQASAWLNEHLLEWLGEVNAADTLTLSAPHNVTSEMGLALLDVADAIRPHPDVVAFLQQVAADGADDGFLAALAARAGGAPARAALEDFLDRYGMRCPGEIDITRPRWSERPTMLVPALLVDVANLEPGAAARRFDDGRRQALAREQEILARLRELPGGDTKATEVEAMVRRVRTFAGYREYPKYNRVRRSFVYKQALLREADALVQAGVLRDREDVFHLRFEEFADAVRTHRVDDALVARRREEYRTFLTLTPPRVLTSDGEAVNGSYRRDDVPPGALAGLAVSAGTVEGRARVVLDLADAALAPGDILVTVATDPGWTPLFLAAAGLVTEVGGLMTHGAVIAREYGLPAVVGVPDATRTIHDGQRIRVHGTAGYVEILP